MSEELNPEYFLEYIIKNLVAHPEETKIKKVEGKKDTILEIYAHPEDIGKIIGKNGSVVRSLRNIVSAVNIKEKKNYIIEIID
ncbi:MAG: KH domain-containing protein [Leptonema sp. (in: bacteria)]